MDSLTNALNFLKDAVVFIMTELKQMERMNMFISTNILTYEVAIQNLLDTIQRLSCPMYAQITSQSTLCSIISLVNSHVLSLQKLVTKMTKWNTSVRAGGFKKFKAIIKDRPSQLSEILFSKLLEIKPLLIEICTLEKQTLGSGVRINNNLLRAAWVLSGSNQVNDSSISKNIIAENLYVLLKKEIGGDIKKPGVWKKAISKLVDAIDGCAAGLPDDMISISELNEFYISPEITTIRQLIKKYIEAGESVSFDCSLESTLNSPLESSISQNETVIDEIVENIEVDFQSKSITYKSPVQIPQCVGYGSNWPSVKILEFTIPTSPKQGVDFDFIEIECEAFDQGWGGSGHNNIRYQINEEKVEVGCFIDRNKNPQNKYKISLNYEKVKTGDIIKLWFSCAPWSGWSGRVESVKVSATFD